MPKLGQLKGTPARRAEFVESLRGLGPGDECIYWPWSDERQKYARVYVDGKKVIASRWVYEQINGLLPERLDPHKQGATGVLVCHSCDNPPCVRPSHLWPGTNQDNLHDASIKGRMKGRPVKLDQSQVEIVRSLLKWGVPQSSIAKAFGVSGPLINMVATGRGRFRSE
jgi:hypothetical protein